MYHSCGIPHLFNDIWSVLVCDYWKRDTDKIQTMEWKMKGWPMKTKAIVSWCGHPNTSKNMSMRHMQCVQRRQVIDANNNNNNDNNNDNNK